MQELQNIILFWCIHNVLILLTVADDDVELSSDKSVTVLLDEEETLVQFIDVAGEEVTFI